MKLRGFITHKAAELYSDCADYFRICPPTKRVAVSDGVGQSIMPAEWARLLVDSFVDCKWDPTAPVKPLQDRWIQQAWAFVDAQKKCGKDPWMLEDCLVRNDGAAATFCGIVFLDSSRWEASILGDSALVLIDKNNRVTGIISSMDGPFGNRPDFYDSIKEKKGDIRNQSGVLYKGEKILLVSDPFSELFQKVKGTDEEVRIITELLKLSAFEEFCSMVDKLREDYHMHNDDTTLVIIEPDGSDKLNIAFQKTLDSSLEEESLRLENERLEKERKKEEDDKLWWKAVEEDTESSYRKYLEKSTLQYYKNEAEKRLKEIDIEKTDNELWSLALSNNTVDSFQYYLANFPKGRHADEAKAQLEKIRKPAVACKKPELNEDSQEGQPSEDPFCKGEKDSENGQPAGRNSQCADPQKEKQDEGASSSAAENDPSGEQDDTSAGPAERESAVPAGPSGDGQPINQPGGIDQEKMEVGEKNEFSLPLGVDPSDGIDKVEFQKLQETALLLFKTYHDRFDAAFRRQKWNTDRAAGINQCFADYWCELERIIFKNTNND